ncbi:MAG: hypothetical protein KatS3mg002_1382 [Candidatus Woesearchaeota archaeon]|nr:MAG: hypothetical protein KatS3mg002_1382 [Candidatus Woesearchaeota archaeon]
MADWKPLQSIEITGAGTKTLTLSDITKIYRFYTSGTVNINAGQTVAIVTSGTPVYGNKITILWECNIVLANSATAVVDFFSSLFTIKGDNSGTFSSNYSTTKMLIELYYEGAAWRYVINPSFEENNIISTDNIRDNAITQVKIADDSVGMAKLNSEEFTRGDIIVGNSNGDPSLLPIGASATILQSNGSDPSWVTVSGDITIATGGEVTIVADKVDNNKLANMPRGTIKVGGVANAPTDLDAKNPGYILVGDGTDIKSVPISGDATLSPTGVLTLTSNPLDLYDENPDSNISNTVTGLDAVAIGEQNTVSGNNAVAIGLNSTASQTGAIALGTSVIASGNYSFTVGLSNTASKRFSVCTGTAGVANRYGEFAHSVAKLGGISGSVQSSKFIASNQTVDDTANVVLYLDGTSTSELLTLDSNSVLLFTINLLALQVGGIAGEIGATASWFIKGMIKNIGGVTTLVDNVVYLSPTAGYSTTTPTQFAQDSTALTWSVAVTADNVNDALKIAVTGEANKIINWVALIETIQTKYA